MDHAIDAVIEIFTWVGLGAGILLAIVTVILKLADGTWLPARAIVEHSDDRSARPLVRRGRRRERSLSSTASRRMRSPARRWPTSSTGAERPTACA